jgi:predicted nucleic acid-binding protein
VPALLDTGVLELLRRRHPRVESLVLKLYPPVVCPQIVGEFLYGQFHTGASAEALVSARLFLAPFEVLPASAYTPDLCAELRARLHAAGHRVPDTVCWIATYALEHQMPLVTTDPDFRRLPGLQVRLIKVPKTALAEPKKRRPARAGRL